MAKWVQYQVSQEVTGSFEAEAVPHMNALFRVAMYLERDRSKAEDLVEETFTQALESFHRFELGANCCAWLVAIMYSVRRKRLRKFSNVH